MRRSGAAPRRPISGILDTDAEPIAMTDSELLGEAQSDSDMNIVIADPQGKIINQSGNYEIKDNDVTVRPGVIRRVEKQRHAPDDIQQER